MSYNYDMDLYDIFMERDEKKPNEEDRKNSQDRKPDCRCTVCLNDLTSDCIRTPCGHFFHRSCLEQAYLSNNTCPNCRQMLPQRWLHENAIAIRMTSEAYWDYVHNELLPAPPEIGPMLPSHQRAYDYQQDASQRPPPRWSRQWIQDQIVEMRVRFNIPVDIVLTVADLTLCENNGILGIFPEWSLPSWVHDNDEL